ncbi:hypothetical protein H696_05869 [Fonticula alba]|uniref:Uncharacterized protein n=1 Tax=Fonticula alba TaxID=691883 RepID=A0A058Z261_FONAL|nr:hypothetical protein H696_05869 [Fonticula alba]KCV67602.1 hypothetical protein H696_05869 [Fonticula alba]|eukprot:XP_009497940.1 hypothetical protein H696_05869 [Fonticula alba]
MSDFCSPRASATPLDKMVSEWLDATLKYGYYALSVDSRLEMEDMYEQIWDALAHALGMMPSGVDPTAFLFGALRKRLVLLGGQEHQAGVLAERIATYYVSFVSRPEPARIGDTFVDYFSDMEDLSCSDEEYDCFGWYEEDAGRQPGEGGRGAWPCRRAGRACRRR